MVPRLKHTQGVRDRPQRPTAKTGCRRLRPRARPARRFEDLNLVSAAVVHEAGRLLRRITVDDVVDVIREQGERSQRANTGLDFTGTKGPDFSE
jgi:Mg/Co/Ni transporter MgtE